MTIKNIFISLPLKQNCLVRKSIVIYKVNMSITIFVVILFPDAALRLLFELQMLNGSSGIFY